MMIETEETVLQNRLKKQRDILLRVAIKAPYEKSGKPDEYLIIDYLIDKLVVSESDASETYLSAR